jgi:predicted RNA-binding protein YlxR (DUF448 family)
MPVRTCTGCRSTDAKPAMLRLVFAGPRLVVSPHGPGRGAYVHPRPACVEAAARGGLARALRRAVAPELVRRAVAEMSRPDDNLQIAELPIASRRNPAGLASAEAVETPPTDVGDRAREGRADAHLQGK